MATSSQNGGICQQSDGRCSSQRTLGHGFKWLHDNRDEGCTLGRWRSYKRTSRSCPVAAWESARRLFRASAIESAASGGLLEIVQWLTKESKACITDAMEGAAGNGYLHVMKWLHMNRNEGCTTGGQWIKRRSSAPWKSCNGYMSTEQRVAPMLRWMEQRGVGTFSLFSGFWRSANLARKSLCWARS